MEEMTMDTAQVVGQIHMNKCKKDLKNALSKLDNFWKLHKLTRSKRSSDLGVCNAGYIEGYTCIDFFRQLNQCIYMKQTLNHNAFWGICVT